MAGRNGNGSPRDRVQAIQWFRGVAVLLVIGLHSIELDKFRHWRLGEPLGLLSAPGFYDHFGASGVDLFFVISGFVMADLLSRLAQGDWRPFIKARLLRILPLYWLATAVMVLLLLFLQQPIGLWNALTSLTIWPVPGRATLDSPILVVGWSLAFELAFYTALVPVTYLTPARRTLAAGFVVCGLALAGQLIKPADNFAALFLNPIWYEFALGLLLHAWWKSGIGRRSGAATAVTGVVFLLLGIWTWVVPETRPFAIYDQAESFDRALFWALPWTAVLAGALTISRGGIIGAILRRIGDASFSLYLTHMMIMTGLLYQFPQGLVRPDLLSVIAVALSLVLGIATHNYVERPLLDWFKGRRSASSAVVVTLRSLFGRRAASRLA